MPYSLIILWRDRRRYWPAVLAVTFSAVLIAVQCGFLFGALLATSVPVEYSSADIWITTADAPALTQAYPLPRAWTVRARVMAEVEQTEEYLLGVATCHKPGQRALEHCLVLGGRADPGSLGALSRLSPEVQRRLGEPDTVVVDEWDLDNLGLKKGVGEFIEVNDHRVRVVGTIRGYQGLNFAWLFCSVQTAKTLLPYFARRPQLTMFGLVKCRRPEDVGRVVSRLREEYPEMGVYPRREFSHRVQRYWLIRSKGGVVMICTVALAMLVGLVVTSQTLYGAILASLREYAVLDALGMPRRRLVGLVLAQSFWIGVVGVVLALPIVHLISWSAPLVRAHVILFDWAILATAAVTMGMALFSGASALRALRKVELATLLR